MQQTRTDAQTGAFEIGAVCDMTGLSHHVLRVWEKRYGAVQPSRQSNRRRLYSSEDVEKLSLLKALVDRGHAIGGIANLAIDELNRRLDASDGAAATAGADAVPRVLFVGPGLRPGQVGAPASERFEGIGHYAELERALVAENRPRADLAVIEWPSLFEQSAMQINQAMRRLGVQRLVVVYDYASAPALDALNPDRIVAIRGPLDTKTLEALVRGPRAAAVADDDGSPPPRRYDDATLARLAGLPNAVRCECPKHLARLVMALGRFEDYSADCQNVDREDAELHRYLHRVSGQARSRLEAALARVIEAESLDSIGAGDEHEPDAR